MNDLITLLLGQVPEGLYFALFMISVKQLKEKRILFIGMMIFQYIFMKQFLHYTVWFQFIYTFMTFVILKILYNKKAQVTDIFTFTIASVTVIISSIICLLLFKNIIIACIIHKIMLFTFIFLTRHKLNRIQNIYKKIWNRNDSINKPIKTTTFRSINVIIFNIIFYVINLGMIYFSVVFKK